jgi:hypothetical protein
MTTPPIPIVRTPGLAKDLIGRAQAARAAWRTPAHQRSAGDPETLTAGQRSDEDNAQALRRIVAKNNWPGRSLVGEEACQAAVDIAVHADHDLPLQITLLRMLRTAVEQGEATPAQWAHLRDRCLVRSGKQQLYGTQQWYGPDGRLEPHPIADPGRLDERRAAVGLPPYTTQAERLNEHHTGPSSISTDPVAVPRPTVEETAA